MEVLLCALQLSGVISGDIDGNIYIYMYKHWGSQLQLQLPSTINSPPHPRELKVHVPFGELSREECVPWWWCQTVPTPPILHRKALGSGWGSTPPPLLCLNNPTSQSLINTDQQPSHKTSQQGWCRHTRIWDNVIWSWRIILYCQWSYINQN